MQPTMNALNLLLCSIPFWIPAAIGVYLSANRPGDLRRMAGLLTLKPIVTTPVWLAILSGLLSSPNDKWMPAHFLSILPGAGVTIVIALAFRHLFTGPSAGRAKILLVLDCARWLNSFLMILPYGGGIQGGQLACVFAVIGLALPSVFAVVALTLTISQTPAEESLGSQER